ncbi:MAG: YqgE/AlgH family protein [Acidimicrobiales bacterium]
MADLALAGRSLVASPLLPDPNFDRTVVLVLVHNDEGALGVVLNRPTDTRVGVPLPKWESLAADPAVVFVGGPVNHQAALCLARVSGGSLGGPETEADGSWIRVAGEVGTLDLDSEPAFLANDLAALRIFAGYAGWGAGQLEAEIAAGAWWVVDADPSDVFSGDPDGLWKAVLRRQRGGLALASAYPDDPSMN